MSYCKKTAPSHIKNTNQPFTDEYRKEKNPRQISVKPEGKGGLLSRSNPKGAYDCKLYRVIRLLDLKREGSE